MIVYTSICMNYLPKALVLGESLKKYNPDVKFVIVLLEREIPKEWPIDANRFVDEVILAKDLCNDDFDKFIFKHSIVEASTSIKGRALVYLLEQYKTKVIYIDPDIMIYNSLEELSKLLDQNDIILTPHLTIPEESEIDIQNNELCALQHGVYNLGFLAVNFTEEGLKFANWWKDRLELYCYDDIPRGIFTDQRWCDLAPAYFNVYILKNPGYNMAPWNLSTRKVEKKEDKIIVNNDYELVFFHYSGFDSGANETVFNYYVPDKDNFIYTLREEYIKKMNDNNQSYLGNYKWSYDYYFSGEKIDKDIRILYRDSKLFETINMNPFSLSNKHFSKLLDSNEKTTESTFRKYIRKLIPFRLRKILKNIFHI